MKNLKLILTNNNKIMMKKKKKTLFKKQYNIILDKIEFLLVDKYL